MVAPVACRRVTLGSPEAERLAAFIQARLPAVR